jgi:hypothetical protein
MLIGYRPTHLITSLEHEYDAEKSEPLFLSQQKEENVSH